MRLEARSSKWKSISFTALNVEIHEHTPSVLFTRNFCGCCTTIAIVIIIIIIIIIGGAQISIREHRTRYRPTLVTKTSEMVKGLNEKIAVKQSSTIRELKGRAG